MKRILFALSTFFTCFAAEAQDYWQQTVNTSIDVTLDDKNHMLRGFEEITYVNESPNTLTYIYIHLWPNAYKHDHTPFAEQQYRNKETKFYFAKDQERGFIDSLQFTIDGESVNYVVSENAPDIARLDLPKPLPHGQTIRISTPFRVKIPIVFSRLGHTGQAYFISQWFPKPAVYDKKGWHPISYLDQGEFYSEFGAYDVRITLPKNYVVMATGNLQTKSEQQWLDSLSTAALPKDTLYNKSYPASSTEMKTIEFKEGNVHDFAWFADKRWIVRKDTVAVPGTGDVVTAYSAFLPGYQRSWKNGVKYLKGTVRYYSKWVGPYPYKTIKAVQGDMSAGGGMEYPTVTIIDRTVGGSKDVIVHEAGHNWFYGIIGSNERDHAWMDEGMNSFYEQKTTHAMALDTNYTPQIPDSLKDKFKKKGVTVTVSAEDNPINWAYYQMASTNEDQAIEQTSENFKYINYGVDVYYKTAMMMEWLESYMGEKEFEEGMHEYYNIWKFRHPYPEDFKTVMQGYSSKPIDWFFESLKTDRKIDYKITGVSNREGKTQINLINKSDVAGPARIDAYLKDSIVGTTWTPPFESSATAQLPDSVKEWDRLSLSRVIPDAKKTNNHYRRNGLFHRGGIQLKPFVNTTLGQKEKIFVLPALGYNQYDGFELGLLFHNATFPERRFKYMLAPMYGFGSKDIIGAGSIGYSFFPRRTFKEILLQADAKSFHYDRTKVNIPEYLHARYLKVAPSLSFTFRENRATSPVTRRFTLKGYMINEDEYNYTFSTTDSLFRPGIQTQQNVYGVLRYLHRNDRTFNPFNYSAELQGHQDFVKLNVEGNLRVDYHLKNKGLHIRAYAGKFIALNNNAPAIGRYYLNSSYTGVNDYLYDDTYFGRTETNNIWAQQISMREGGFKVPTPLYANPIGRSDDWLAAVNLKTDLPLKWLPVRLFFDIGTFANAGKLNPSGSKLIYDGGVEIHALRNILAVYVPFIMSEDLRDYMKTIHGKNAFGKSIVFSIQLHNINWLKAPSKAMQLAGEGM